MFAFFFFFRRLGVFIDTRLMKVCLPNVPYGFLMGKLYTCQHFKEPFFLTWQHFFEASAFILYRYRFLFGFPLPWGLLLFLKTLSLGFNWPFLGKWFLGILLLVEIRFTFVVELPLLSCVMSASWSLASSSTRMRMIKVSKDVSFYLCRKVFINYANYHQIFSNLYTFGSQFCHDHLEVFCLIHHQFSIHHMVTKKIY